MIFHVGYLFSEILVRNCDGYNKFIRIESVYMISLFLFVFLFLLGLIYYLYRFFFQKGIKIESSYLSMNNEEKYIKDFNTIKALVFKESRGNCWFFIKSVFRSLCLLENKNKKTISTQKQFILQSLQEIYNISSERANQLEELAELTLSFPLTNKEEKYIEKCKEFVEKGGDIEKYKELLNCLASAIGIEKKRAEELIKNIKEKYQRKQ